MNVGPRTPRWSRPWIPIDRRSPSSRNTDATLRLTYSCGCGATANNVYWSGTPGGEWTGSLCAIDSTGAYATFDQETEER